MKPPRLQPPPKEPRQVGVRFLNSEDWPERYWRGLVAVMPELEEPPPVEIEEEPQPPKSA